MTRQEQIEEAVRLGNAALAAADAANEAAQALMGKEGSKAKIYLFGGRAYKAEVVPHYYLSVHEVPFEAI